MCVQGAQGAVGLDKAAVTGATTASPQYIGEVRSPRKVVAGLDYETTYYWRIDTSLRMEHPPFDTILVKGNVWSFKTVPPGLGYVLREWWTGIDDDDCPDAPPGEPDFDNRRMKRIRCANAEDCASLCPVCWKTERDNELASRIALRTARAQQIRTLTPMLGATLALSAYWHLS